jgi:glutathione synthase/RimK-type ligase-like ATP-grasp enzyme
VAPRRLAVLVVGPRRDAHARAVAAALERRGVAAVFLDTGRFPARVTLVARLEPGRHAGWSAALRGADRFDAAAVGTIWWWRPCPYLLPRAIAGARRDALFCAADAALAAFWAGAAARWVNDRVCDESADDKARQLALAARLGLAVPRTLLTNDAAAARAFVAERADGETIHKNVTSAAGIWRPTALARRGDRALFASLKRVPLMFQERVRAEADVRVTVVGGELFAAEIVSRDPEALDFRPDLQRARYRAVTLPSGIERKLRRMVRDLGLAYAALDLRRRPDGEHVFLEVNPGGQWLFVERRTGQRITEAVADLLASRAQR